jgi:hypothetical protein
MAGTDDARANNDHLSPQTIVCLFAKGKNTNTHWSKLDKQILDLQQRA